MRIAKYLHSCLLVEQDGVRLLIDPGRFSFVEGRVDPMDFAPLDAVALTHHHPDQADPEALAAIVHRTGAQLIGNLETAGALGAEGLDVTVPADGGYEIGPLRLEAIPADHEPILDDHTPANTAYLVGGRLLHCGDSLHPKLLAHRGVAVAAVPVMAPFLTERAVAGFVAQLQPGAVLPVHDGHARDFFLRQRYETYRRYVERLGITFHALTEPGAAITI
ncbi:MBL fold metallo-hydrolase [Micromonospora sp. WMMD1102]|uniref:MBL fold metallo-hydrolase n=1 Tax=Micromonospora sp. WMMD1102 TaxID=3016105 RepID=UPI002415194D|nr:MBL fold metallo-hydrolase [Micromonospora sp. WMMD1102]MDG4786125.1 MBL fold metallo-hydrolase [Micromonospora sp. WMMD1102]